jgi:hypothetical protein
MNQNKKTFIFLFGGMAVMVVTTVCGAVIVIALDDAAGGSRHWHYDVIFGGIIGAFVGVPIWGLLGYMVYRKKNAAPNEIIPDDTST